jgi:hypothetical protein
MLKKIIDLPNCKLSVSSEYSLDNVIGYGSRLNNKRKFLFISKILGKHIPVSPQKLITTHKKLSKLINPFISNENVLVIGLAETSTGLGWGVFDQIIAKSKFYIHTSRVKLKCPLMVDFEEPHSHAVEQYLYFPKHKAFNQKSIDHIIIVDDEITTGNTIKNLIIKLSVVFPGVKFSVLTLVNWKNYSKDFNIYALHEGTFKFTEKDNDDLVLAPLMANEKKSIKYKLSNQYGRVGAVSFPVIPKHIVNLMSKFQNKQILLLGTGEFMHFPLVASSYFQPSNTLKIQSTTRSPVQIGGDIYSKLTFKDNYYPTVSNYLYNVIDKKYDVVVIFYEAKSKYDHLLINALSQKFNKIIPIYL